MKPKPLALLRIDFRTGLPIYKQIMKQIERQISAGELQAGDQLPTLRVLALQLQVNFNTVARAYRGLDRAGWISTQQGRGTYIRVKPSARVDGKLRTEALRLLARQYIGEAKHLNFSHPQISQMMLRQLNRWRDKDPQEKRP